MESFRFDRSDVRKRRDMGSVNRNVILFGTLLIIVGLSLVGWEVATGMFFRRTGPMGYAAVLALGISCSVWGLKDIVAQIWPRLAARGYYFRLPREGLVFLILTVFIFSGSILGRSNMLMMVFSLMVGAFLMNGWLTFVMLQGALTCRTVPSRTMAGEPVGVALSLENRVPWISARLMTVHDTVSHASQSLDPEVLFVQVPPKSQATGHYHFEPAQRGRYQFSRIDITTRFPLGLVQRGVHRDQFQEMLVYPRIGHLRPGWTRQRSNSEELSNQSRGSAGTFQDEFHQLREYRVGDDRRMIHWRTSARLDDLMVAEYQEVRDRDLYLIVDAWLPKNASSTEIENLERGLRFATTVSMEALHANRHSSLYVELLGEESFRWHGDVERDPDSLLDAFAVLSARNDESLDQVRQLISAERLRSRRTVIVTQRPVAIQKLLLNWEDGVPPDVEVLGTSQAGLAGVFADSD